MYTYTCIHMYIYIFNEYTMYIVYTLSFYLTCLAWVCLARVAEAVVGVCV